MARITRMTKRRLGELLQAEGLITEEHVRQGLELQRKNNLFLGEALVQLGFVSEEAIAHTLVQQFSLPFMSASQYGITSDVLNLFPERMYYEYQFIAVDKMGKVLIIIGAGLMNHDVLDELERLSGCRVCQFVSTWKDIRSALDAHAKDMRKEQSDLTSLGTMLLEFGDTPPQQNTPPPENKQQQEPMQFQPPPVVKVPAAMATATVPGFVRQTSVIPGISSGGMPVTPPGVHASGSGSSPGVPAAPGTSTVPRPAPTLNPMRPAASTNMVPAGAGRPPGSAVPPSGGGRLTALVGIRPPGAGMPPPASGKTVNPNAAPPPSGTQTPNAQPPSSKGNTGLLGLFKKQ